MLTSALLVAVAGASDLAVHTMGVQGGLASSVGAGDLDLLIGERLRWSVSDAMQVHVDVRFLVDPSGQPTFERYRVRRLGLTWTRGITSLSVGRHPVVGGGPRLVDGLQVMVDLAPVQLGVWAGLAPDLFTTAPRLRPGFGPMLAFTRSKVRASLVGDVLFAEGALDRFGLLATGRYAPNRLLALDTRVDVELVSVEGGPHLADARVGVTSRPTDAVRLGAYYDAFSSLRYLQTENLDPELRRFDSRILAEGLADGFDQDQRDPFVNHLVGADLRIREPGEQVAPVFEFGVRYRHHPDPKNRFTAVNTRAGITRVGGRVELDALGLFRRVDDVVQADLGGQLVIELGDGCCVIDTSALALINPERYVRPGAYADLFADAVLDSGLTFGLGLNAIVEPIDAVEFGLAGFGRIAYYQRGRSRTPDPAGLSSTP
jgi:hypothetical protein